MKLAKLISNSRDKESLRNKSIHAFAFACDMLASFCVLTVLDLSSWPDVDSQPLSLEDSWRLRVVSAQVYSIIKSRDLEHFERVIGFVETTYRLLPRLIPAIKHMKIMFGLKTMVGK